MTRLVPATSYPALVGLALGHLRAQRGVTSAAFAKRMGLAPSSWSRIENGKSALTIEHLVAACELLEADTRTARVLAADGPDVRPSHVLKLADELKVLAESRGIRVNTMRGGESVAEGVLRALLRGVLRNAN